VQRPSERFTQSRPARGDEPRETASFDVADAPCSTFTPTGPSPTG